MNLNTFYGAFSEFCTAQTCPTMAVGPQCVNRQGVWTMCSSQPYALPGGTSYGLITTGSSYGSLLLRISTSSCLGRKTSSTMKQYSPQRRVSKDLSFHTYSVYLTLPSSPVRAPLPRHPTPGDFPSNFPGQVKLMYRLLLNVFAHIYHVHFPIILHLRSEPHFNSLFAHFLAFGREFGLLDMKDVKGGVQSSTAYGMGPVAIGDLWEKWKEMGILEW